MILANDSDELVVVAEGDSFEFEGFANFNKSVCSWMVTYLLNGPHHQALLILLQHLLLYWYAIPGFKVHELMVVEQVFG